MTFILPKNLTAKKWLEKMNKMVNYECPAVGEEFFDCEHRKLRITEIDMQSCMGREIKGVIYSDVSFIKNSFASKDYSCTLDIWKDVWRDRIPRADAAKMVC